MRKIFGEKENLAQNAWVGFTQLNKLLSASVGISSVEESTSTNKTSEIHCTLYAVVIESLVNTLISGSKNVVIDISELPFENYNHINETVNNTIEGPKHSELNFISYDETDKTKYDNEILLRNFFPVRVYKFLFFPVDIPFANIKAVPEGKSFLCL